MKDDFINLPVFLLKRMSSFDNDAARDLIKSLGVEQAVTTIRPNQFLDETTAAKWALAEQAIVDLMTHLKI